MMIVPAADGVRQPPAPIGQELEPLGRREPRLVGEIVRRSGESVHGRHGAFKVPRNQERGHGEVFVVGAG
jgi:hypothetical protein